MKTGLIIEAEETDKGLNNFSIKRVHVKGEDWVNNEGDDFNMVDANKWTDLMVEGIITVIYNAHERNVKDSAEYLREVIHKLEQAFIKPADVSVVHSEEKEILGRNSNNNLGDYGKNSYHFKQWIIGIEEDVARYGSNSCYIKQLSTMNVDELYQEYLKEKK